MKKAILHIVVSSLLLSAPILHAQDDVTQQQRATPAIPAQPATPAANAQRASPAPAGQAAVEAQHEKDFVALEANMKSLQAQATKIENTKDAAERQELLAAHFTSMQANMKSMQALMKSMNGVHAQAERPEAR
jgi:hypothetical protein